MKYLALVFTLLLFESCNSPVPETVTATANPPKIILSSNTDKPVHYVLIETKTSHLVDLADPCQNFQPNLPAHSKLILPYNQMMGFNKEAESAWFYWTDCQGNSGSETIELF